MQFLHFLVFSDILKNYFAICVKNKHASEFVLCGFIICHQNHSCIFNRCFIMTLLHFAKVSDFIRSVCPQAQLLC